MADTFQWLSASTQSISESGPILGSLYLLMLLGCILSVFLSFRRRGSLSAFASALSPFIFGALALWIRFFGFAQVTSGGMYHGNHHEDVRRVQRPLESGLALSAICLVIYFVASNQRKPNGA